MAVLALGFAGQAIGASIGGSILGVTSAAIGGFIGSTIGGMIDNMLFPSKQEGPRLDDLSVTVSTYGNPIPLLYGPENRIAGNVIWSTGLIETTKKSRQGKGGPSVQTTEYSYRASFAVALCQGQRAPGDGAPISRVRKIWANNKLIYDAGAPAPDVPVGLYEAMRFYPGSFSQQPDPTIEGYVGAGQAPAYRGTAYVVFQDLQLADFGNRLPNLEFLVEAQDEINVSEVVFDVATRCGLDPNLISTLDVGDHTVRGFAIGQAASGVGALQPLALAYDFDVAEVAGALRCVRRGSSPLGLITLDQLGGHDATADRSGDVISWSRTRVTALPRQSTVTFPDPDRDWQPNSQSAQRSEGSADNALSTSVPLVLTADQGRALADRLLWEAWTGQQTATAQTDDRWISIEPGRLYYVETPAGFEPIRVTRVTRGWNGVIDMELRRDRSEVYRPSSPGVPSTVPDNGLNLPGLTEVILLDIPLLLDADDAKGAGFYWGFVGSGAGWRGADFLRSIDDVGPFVDVEPQGRELTVGQATEALPAPLGDFDPDADWDMASVITVELRRPDMVLESLTDAEVLAGGNAAYVGPFGDTDGEIIQFANADLVEPGVYEISRLRRGQRGTDYAWAGHAIGDQFVLLEPGALKRADFGLADLNQERFYKGVSLLTLEADTDAVEFVNTGRGLAPYSPTGLTLEGDTGGDLVLSWTRRSRIGWPQVQPPPLAEESEAYRLQIMNAAGTVVEREVNLTGVALYVYTAAQQTADFGAPVSSLRWRVAQISASVGVGPFAESSGPV